MGPRPEPGRRARERAERAADGPLATPSRGHLNRNLNRDKNRKESLSMFAAGILMPDAAGIAHACGVVAASAKALYGRTEVEDAILLMENLGIAPKREDRNGRA